MTYKFSDSGSSFRISCKYDGHALEGLAVLGGFFSVLLYLAFFIYVILLDNHNFGEINWSGIAEIGFFMLALLFYLGTECLWQFFGKELFILSENGIILRHQIFGLGLSRRFDIEKINGVFLTKVRDTNVELRMFLRARSYGFFYFKQGKIAFNSGKPWLFREPNTFRFGTDLAEDEAKQIVAKIHQRFPKYQYDWWNYKS